MRKQVDGQLTLFQEDSPVSRSLKPGSEEARMMTVTSGQKCLELYANSSPLGCLVRTCLESSIWHSTRCFLTWKTRDTPAKHSLFQLAVSMPRTDETESLFWPTPSTGAALCGGTGNFKTLKKMAEKGMITEEERRQLSQGNGGKTNPGLLEWLMGYEQEFTKLIPTPCASMYRGGMKARYWTPSSQISHVERERERGTDVPPQSERTAGMHSAWSDWPDEPGVDRVVDGIPNRVDRIRCLGNAVVPQQFYPFFEAIATIERNRDGQSKQMLYGQSAVCGAADAEQEQLHVADTADQEGDGGTEWQRQRSRNIRQSTS